MLFLEHERLVYRERGADRRREDKEDGGKGERLSDLCARVAVSGHWARIGTERFGCAHLVFGSVPKTADEPTSHVPCPGVEPIVEHGGIDRLFEQARDERELGLVSPVQLGFAERRLVEMAS